MFAVPIGLMSGIYAAEYAGTRLAAATRFAADGNVYAKLGLTIDDSVDRRVKAVLMFLDDRTPA